MQAVVSANTKQLQAMGKQLRSIQPVAYRKIHRNLLAEGKRLAAEVKQEASFSKRIPATVRVRTSGIAGIIISAGTTGKDSAAPEAKVLEHAGKQGTFRHPLFGLRGPGDWQEQKAHPFLHPVILRNLELTTGTILAAIVEAAQEALAVKEV